MDADIRLLDTEVIIETCTTLLNASDSKGSKMTRYDLRQVLEVLNKAEERFKHMENEIEKVKEHIKENVESSSKEFPVLSFKRINIQELIDETARSIVNNVITWMKDRKLLGNNAGIFNRTKGLNDEYELVVQEAQLLTNILRELEIKKEEKVKELNEIEEKLKEKSNKYKKTKEGNENYNNEIKSFPKKVQNQKTMLMESIDKWSKAWKGLSSKLEENREKVRNALSLVKKKKNELKEYKERLNQLQKKSVEMFTAEKTKENKLTLLKEKEKELEKISSGLKEEINKLKKEKAELINEVKKLKARIEGQKLGKKR